MTRVACIDIGTVTVRLAVADVERGRVVRMAKQSAICDLGEGLATSGRIGDAAQARVVSCVDAYLAAARASKAPVACCTLTSAARDATNADELTGALRRRGLAPQVIPGETEGSLTFLGVAQDFPDAPILIADNGGGSTELALGILRSGTVELAYVRSVDVGCRRITDLHLAEQPSGVATPEARTRAHAWASGLLTPAVEAARSTGLVPERLLACGGTVTTLVAMDAELDPYNSAYVHLHELALAQVERLEERLAPLAIDERAALPGLQPQRAHVILGGTIIIDELLRATGFDALTVSESDLLFGLALSAAAAAAGAPAPVGWLPTLAAL